MLTEENHIWFHKQPPEIQSKLNRAFQELKRRKDLELKVETVDISEIPFELDVCDLQIDRNGRIKIYNRAKVKEEMRKIIAEEYDREE